MLFALTLFNALFASAADKAMVEAAAPEKKSVWVGERVVIGVQLLVQGQFSGAIYFDIPDVEGIFILPPSGRPVMGSRNDGGETYVSQNHEFTVFPQRPGTIRIPPITARFGSKESFNAEVVEHSLKTPEIQFEAKSPPGAVAGEVIVSTINLSIQETWNPKPDKAKVGDSFTRTITFKAAAVPGMVLPALKFEESPGLAVYPKEAQVRDQTERGDFTGQRVESVTYVCESPGKVVIPELKIRWWNPEAEEWKEKEFASVELDVAENPVLAEEESKAATGSASMAWLWGIGVVVAVLLGLWFSGPRLLIILGDWKAKREAGEPRQFKRLLKACRAEDYKAAYDELSAWLDRFGYNSGEMSSGGMPADSGSLKESSIRLQQRLIGMDADWDGAAMAGELVKLRHSLISASRAASNPALGPLNPS